MSALSHDPLWPRAGGWSAPAEGDRTDAVVLGAPAHRTSLSPTGAELLFEVFSQRYERGSTIVTSNLPFEDWTSVLGSERLTGALLDRLTHHVSILAMNGDSYRLRQSAGRRRATAAAEQNQATPDNADPETGEIIP